MGNKDTSRSMFDPRKHYTGAWTLQGRLVTDFDQNDRESIMTEERRRALLDIVGVYGSPDDGFRVANVRSVGGLLDFDLLAGSLYLGGLRLELEELQTYRTQRDQLQLEATPVESRNQQGRRDLVLLEAYEAPVTAVEDGELLDPAIGVDTSARSRRFQRIRVLRGVRATTCEQARQLLNTMMADTDSGALGVDCRQVVDTRLAVTYSEEGVDDDLCEPPLTGGYLGAENQAIRVQLVDSDQLTWGYDNAAPLYRISLSADRLKVTLITPPRDQYSVPIVGQVIEILPWGALLSNGEKAAALSGHLTRITAVDPSDEAAGGAITLTLANAVPVAGFDDWKSRPDAAALQAGGVFYAMHIWNRGGDITSAPAITFVRGTPLALGTTGIEVTISGADAVRDDYWIIAARPETPTRAYPWELELGAAPDGMHRYYAPLALIRWRNDGSSEVSDCRPPFRPLTAIDGCCSFSVGDGVTSDGDYNDLGQALARLGANGGEICLLPGVHRANVVLAGRNNITISGCGSRSKLIPRDPNGMGVITLNDCSRIGLFNFEIVSVDGSGITAELVDGLRIEDVKILAANVGIDVEEGQSTTIRRCVIRMLDKAGGDVGIYAQGDQLLIEDCDLQLIPGGALPDFPDDHDPDTPPVDPSDPCADPRAFYGNLIYLVYYVDLMWGLSTFYTTPRNPHQTLGGLQIGSGSAGVVVRRNTIVGGAGNGITLGSDIADIALDEPDRPPGDVEDVRPVELNHDFDLIRGKVIVGEETMGGMTITFDDGRGGIYSFPVSAGGTFEGKLPPGAYTVSVSEPNYSVVEVEPLGQGDYYVYLRAREVPAPEPGGGADLLAFIHEVLIEQNQIANMGFSGIGAPRFTSADDAAGAFGAATRGKTSLQLLFPVYAATGTITGFVVDLTIYRNTIARCLQNAPLTNVDQFAIERALGGISLALCDGVTIAENVIQDCGRGAEMPVCGVFISFSVDVTIRENHILNNGQDRRAEQLLAEYVATPEDVPADTIREAPDAERSDGRATEGGVRRDRKTIHSKSYERYRAGLASGDLRADVPAIEFGPGPRAGILLPLCFSSNVFAGGASLKASASLSTQGRTGSAEGRHAARVDGNYVVQPYGKTLFIGAAGSLSITDNQLISDRALPRDLDARAGGFSGQIGAGMRLDTLDLFASNVMVANICPGSYMVDLLAQVKQAEAGNPQRDLKLTPIPFGFPDGNILCAGNQIKQGDAGARPCSVTIFSLDDVAFVDNQIDVLNATDIRTTCIVFGATARAANNRMKEPMFLALQRPGDDKQIERFSLLELGIMAAGMVNNQGHYCFRLLTDNGAEFGNIGILAGALGCRDGVRRDLPSNYALMLRALLTIGANFAKGLSKSGA